MSAKKTWNKDTEDYLTVLMTASWTREEIAKKINDRFGTAFTRSAITGKIHMIKGTGSEK